MLDDIYDMFEGAVGTFAVLTLATWTAAAAYVTARQLIETGLFIITKIF